MLSHAAGRVSPIALEAVRRFDVIFAWERSINGLLPIQRLAVRAKEIAPLIEAFEVWMRTERAKLSRHAEVAKAMDYMLKRWTAFTRFLVEGRICLSNNAAERALRASHWVAKPGSSPVLSGAVSAPRSCAR
jgi:hypothetical protein